MSDLDRIKTIEATLGFSLNLVSFEELYKKKSFRVSGLMGTRNYSVDEDGYVTGLAIDFAPSFQLPKAYFAGFSKLRKLRMAGSRLRDYSALVGLECLQTLNLRASRITDYSFLETLSSLTALNLSDTQIDDSSFIGALRSLESLQLRNSHIEDYSFLSNLKSLTSLNLSRNRINDCSFLAHSKPLITLDLSATLIKDFSTLADLKSLEQLSLNDCLITDCSFVSKLESLTRLSISNNPIKDYSFLEEMKSLKLVNLHNNGLKEGTFLAKLDSLTSLTLSSNQISDVSFLADMRYLTSLDLHSNQISHIPAFEGLRSLRSLDLGGNKISDIAFLREVTALSTLDLSENNIKEVSGLGTLQLLNWLNLSGNLVGDYSNLSRLKSLRTLNLSNCQIKDCSFLKNLGYLITLDLSNNYLRDPSPLLDLQSLKNLILNNNEFNDYSFLVKLGSLSSLGLCGNRITDASFLSELTGLKWLNLAGNRISDVTFVSQLTSLRTLQIIGNPIVNPPYEIVNKGLDQIRNYFKQLEEQGVDFNFEAKVLIVGDPGAGKTTLFKKLQNNKYVPRELTEEEKKSTVGVNIKKGWKFKFSRDKKVTFKANLWDFGGQPSQYILHQYFLTERSLYVLLVNKREESPTTFNYWFEIIGTLGKECPVLVVLNEINYKSAAKFDVSKYEREFPQISVDRKDVDFSLEDGRFQDLQSEIQTKLSNLLHVGERIPANWTPIRKALERLRNKNFINIDEYFRICAKYSILNEESQRTLLSYLRDVGVALYYESDNHLCNYVILNPHWVIDSLYAVLESDAVQKNNGKFDRRFVYDLWKDKGYKTEDCQILLDLMLKGKFEIAYQINDSQFIVPILLPYQTPDYSNYHCFNSGEAIQIHFKYDFKPPGILARLIVRLNEFIYRLNGVELVWQAGVIFESANAIAEVIELEHQEEITIKVLGRKQKDFLTYIRNKVHEVHKEWFKDRLDFDELVPCGCEVCKNLAVPHYFKLRVLNSYLQNREETIICEKSVEKGDIQRPNIRRLLDGIYLEEMKNSFSENSPNQFNIKVETTVQNQITNQLNEISDRQMESLLDVILSKLGKEQIVEFEKFGEEVMGFLGERLSKLSEEQRKRYEDAKSDGWKRKVKLVAPLIKHIGIELSAERDVKAGEITSGIRKVLYGDEINALNLLNNPSLCNDD